jgi:methylisocitrate lyase
MGAAERALDTLRSAGTLVPVVEEMQTRARLYELLDYEGYNTFDSGVFNFVVPGTDAGTGTGGPAASGTKE